jgi:hypothetical protein
MRASSTNTNGLDESYIIFGRSIMCKREDNGPSLAERVFNWLPFRKIFQLIIFLTKLSISFI